jgi:hypothetical protein
MYFDFCGIDTTLNRNQRPEALGTIKTVTLESGEPYETHESGGKTIQVWHPNWLGQVDESVTCWSDSSPLYTFQVFHLALFVVEFCKMHGSSNIKWTEGRLTSEKG